MERAKRAGRTGVAVLAAGLAMVVFVGCGRNVEFEWYKTVGERRQTEDYAAPSPPDTRVVLAASSGDEVEVGRIVYKDDLAFEIYYPPGTNAPDASGMKIPLVVQTQGFARNHFSFAPPNTRWVESFSQLLAERGLATLYYEAMKPEEDLYSLMEYLRRHQGDLGLDMERVGIFGNSGHGGMAVLALTDTRHPFSKGVRAGVLWHAIAAPVSRFRVEAPLLVIYTDKPSEISDLRLSSRVFAERARSAGVDVTVITDAPHKNHQFDDDSAESIAIIRKVLDFFVDRLAE